MRHYLIFICLLLSACAVLPPAFEEEQKKAISYKPVSEDLASYKDTVVRWGGVIVDVNNEENYSLMQVLYYPLDYYGRPDLDKPSEGQFVIKSTNFLDPKAYAVNRKISVVGKIDRETERVIDSNNISIPLIISKGIYLWPMRYDGNYYRLCPSCYYRQLFW
jgi:outer membrane lipoprotein